jgi:hypothetical protein
MSDPLVNPQFRRGWELLKVAESLPAKPIFDRDDRRAEKNGKERYIPILSWPERGTADRWSAALVGLAGRQHPSPDHGRALNTSTLSSRSLEPLMPRTSLARGGAAARRTS